MSQPTPAPDKEPVAFELDEKTKEAIKVLAGDRKVKVEGRIEDGKLRLVGFEVLPFGACNSAYCEVGDVD